MPILARPGLSIRGFSAGDTDCRWPPLPDICPVRRLACAPMPLVVGRRGGRGVRVVRRLFVGGFAVARFGLVVSPGPPARWWAGSARCPDTPRAWCPGRRPDPGPPCPGGPWCCGGVGGLRVGRGRVCRFLVRGPSRGGFSGRGGTRTAGPTRRAGVPGLRPRHGVVGFGAPPGTTGHGAAGAGWGARHPKGHVFDSNGHP
jgi:hypothetical protein